LGAAVGPGGRERAVEERQTKKEKTEDSHFAFRFY